MEHYYSLVILICPILIIAGAVWFVRFKDGKVALIKTKLKSLFVRRTADDSLFKEYSKQDYSESSLLTKLRELSIRNPHNCHVNSMEGWFKENAKKMTHDGACLAYIEHYRYLEELFWKNIEETDVKIDQDEKFQRILISVCQTTPGVYTQNFSKMLFHFGMKHHLLPELEALIQNDPRFKDPKHTYELAHECVEIKKSKN